MKLCKQRCQFLHIPGTSITNNAPDVFLFGQATTVIFTAKDAAGNTDTATATVTIGSGHLLSVRVLGLVKETDPNPNVRVLLNHPETGAFIKEVKTDENGLADFGDIGMARATITIKGAQLNTLINVLAGAYIYTLSPGPGDTAQGTFSPTVTIDPQDFVPTSGFFQLGYFDGNLPLMAATVNGGTLSIPSVNVVSLKKNGLFDLFAYLEDSQTSTSICGFQDNLDPATIATNPPAGATFRAQKKVPFVANLPVGVDSIILRNGSVFNMPRPSNVSATGMVPFCGDALVSRYHVLFSANSTPENSTALDVGLTFSTLPTLADLNNVTLPKLSLGSLTRDATAQSFSWTVSGLDKEKMNQGDIELSWTDPVTGPMEWSIDFDSTGGTLSLPQLPVDTETVDQFPAMPPSTGVSFFLNLCGYESASGP